MRKDNTWFLRVGRGGLLRLKGAGEAAAAQFPADTWVRISGPSEARAATDWHAARTLMVEARG
eukprot:15438453-Alexandrium_andersonii.AAC.1